MLSLVMIVKNEEHVIERSLQSALPYVDRWCIVDTGSTDSTIEKIHAMAAKYEKPGTLYERPWLNFGHNRSELLELARKDTNAAWFFMLDADDILVCGTNDTKHTKDTKETKEERPFDQQFSFHDAYTMTFKRGTITYKRPAIFNTKPWVFKGALHEYAHLDGASIGNIHDRVWVDARVEGARSQNPNKYQDDALALEKDFTATPDSRTAFYAAQSWRDCGNSQKSIEWYLQRTRMGGWPQEIYISYLNLIRLTEDIPLKFKYAWAALALQINPRLETAHAVLEYLRKRDMWSPEAYYLGLAYAEKVKEAKDEAKAKIRKHIDNDLFTEPEVVYKFYDEFSIHSFYTGHDDIAIINSMKAYFAAPPTEQPRILSNAKFSIQR